MNRSINFMAIVLAVIGIGGIVVWKIVLPSQRPRICRHISAGATEIRHCWRAGDASALEDR